MPAFYLPSNFRSFVKYLWSNVNIRERKKGSISGTLVISVYDTFVLAWHMVYKNSELRSHAAHCLMWVLYSGYSENICAIYNADDTHLWDLHLICCFCSLVCPMNLLGIDSTQLFVHLVLWFSLDILNTSSFIIFSSG